MAQILRQKSSQWSIAFWILLIFNLFVLPITLYLRGGSDEDYSLLDFVNTSLHSKNRFDYELIPRKGAAVALPSIRVAEQDRTELSYGGKGDKPHLGGFTDLDHQGVSPATWKWMVSSLGVHSLLDVGCGRGVSTSWFLFHGVDVLCVEGSHDAVENSVLPNPSKVVVEHDFSRGAWWPEKTYDAVWCVEFIEHIGRNLQKNYITAFRKAAFIFVSHSNWGGYHHVEVHDEAHWIQKFTMFGFVYSEELSKSVHAIAMSEKNNNNGTLPNGMPLNAQHVWLTLKVFINPAVASLPQHAHLLAEPGCFLKTEKGERVNRECGTGDSERAKIESVLPDEFKPLEMTENMDHAWFEHVKARVKDRSEEGAELIRQAQARRAEAREKRNKKNE
mmetsp:Transcript_1007/g.1550  ORF Transcript_1007/g.1550 Transcript_1007/m.1550 type:complete len:389 (-) Transcript_1007:53-1219(-)